MVTTLTLPTPHQGLHPITREVADVVTVAARHGSLAPDGSGLCTLFIRHTSASLLIQENADPSARHDLEVWLNHLVPEQGPAADAFTHTDEGPDDMPSHIKAALTATSLSIPIIGGKLALGTWQGVYLWEHRRTPHQRQVVVHVGP
jgi:secondary thiamine-phosphate synthase enzyme